MVQSSVKQVNFLSELSYSFILENLNVFAKPGLLGASLFVTLFSWNEYAFVLVLTSKETQTPPVRTAGVSSDYLIRWGELSSVATFTMATPLVVAVLSQRYVVEGLLGAVA